MTPNPPAFPILVVDRPKELTQYNGMSLRDYFAAKAMQSFCANTRTSFQEDAELAYRMADAMLEARK